MGQCRIIKPNPGIPLPAASMEPRARSMVDELNILDVTTHPEAAILDPVSKTEEDFLKKNRILRNWKGKLCFVWHQKALSNVWFSFRRKFPKRETTFRFLVGWKVLKTGTQLFWFEKYWKSHLRRSVMNPFWTEHRKAKQEMHHLWRLSVCVEVQPAYRSSVKSPYGVHFAPEKEIIYFQLRLM